jgi:Secretion system C-terminal sorting domain
MNFGTEGSEQDTVLPQTLSKPRFGFVSAFGNDGHIYLFGGISPDYKSGLVAVPDVVQLDGITPVKEIPNRVPAGYKLDQNYPNPFNPTTTINFAIPSPGSRVSLDVYNALGQKVKSLVGGYFHAGSYSVSFNGENMPSGAYIYRLQTENGSIYRKMVLIK